jgi:hypothetical protein
MVARCPHLLDYQSYGVYAGQKWNPTQDRLGIGGDLACRWAAAAPIHGIAFVGGFAALLKFLHSTLMTYHALDNEYDVCSIVRAVFY